MTSIAFIYIEIFSLLSHIVGINRRFVRSISLIHFRYKKKQSVKYKISSTAFLKIIYQESNPG
ncbi:hypothetical protein IW22_16065 [Chryseobacterium sp. JM1]|nr:hypothetical protein IW22_16065 [Chryseobacterium sp. JM1]